MVNLPHSKYSWQIKIASEAPDANRVSQAIIIFYQRWYHTFGDKKGNVISGEYPYPGFSVEKKYQRQQTVEQDPKKYTRGGGSRKVNTKVD